MYTNVADSNKNNDYSKLPTKNPICDSETHHAHCYW